jgi:hypothetical protein
MKNSITFDLKNLDHESIAQNIFDTVNVREVGFGVVRFKLHQMGITNPEEIKKVTDLIWKKLGV